MAIAVVATKNTVCNAYTAIGAYVGAATGDPGTSSTPANEASGGGYIRIAVTWPSATSGASTPAAGASLSLAAGTYTFMFMASSATVGAATMFDKASITSSVLSTPGSLVITPTFTIT